MSDAPDFNMEADGYGEPTDEEREQVIPDLLREARAQAETAHLAVCADTHGREGNDAIVYGHHGSVRICIRLYGTDTWIYDPRWEA